MDHGPVHVTVAGRSLPRRSFVFSVERRSSPVGRWNHAPSWAVAVVTVNSVGARPVQSSARAASVAVFRMSVICPLSRQQGARRPLRARPAALAAS